MCATQYQKASALGRERHPRDTTQSTQTHTPGRSQQPLSAARTAPSPTTTSPALRRQPQLSAGRTDCRPAAAASRHPPSHGTPHCGPPALRPAEHTQPVAARRRHNAPRLAQGHWHCGQASRRAAAAPWLWPSPDPVASACSEHTGSQTQSRGNKTESLELEAEACRMQARKLTWVGHRHPGTAAVVKTIVLHL